MSKFALVSAATGVLLFASVASAQVYYPQTYTPTYNYSNQTYTSGYAPAYNTQTYPSTYVANPLSIGTISTFTNSFANCTILTSNLSYGMRNPQVRELQRFLVSLNFPGGGSWMITGYFGPATRQAVRNFQQQSGLAVSGYVDAST